MIIDDKMIESFWKKVNKTKSCWIWTAGRTTTGYGNFSGHRNGKKWNIKAHRFSYTVVNGEIPSGLFVCHKCDNTLCVNPDHLFLGSAAENTRDMCSKGRQSRGESRHNARLSEDDVIQIRNSSLPGKTLANIYKVSRRTIRDVKSLKTWAWLEHVPPILENKTYHA